MPVLASFTFVCPKDNDPRLGLNGAVAEVLNGERAAAGWTFDKLAERSGIPKRTLMRLVSPTSAERRAINLDRLEQLATAFGLTPAEVLTAAAERLARADTDDCAESDRSEG